MSNASGIVIAIVKTPHGLSASALTNDEAQPGERDDDDEQDGDGRP